MVTDNTKNQVKALYKKLKEVNINSLSAKKCNGYIQHLEYLKNMLYGIGEHWVEKIEEVQEVEDIFGMSSVENLEEAIGETSDQIDLIMAHLGIEENENINENVSNSPPMNININPSFSQNQSTNITVETQVSNLYQEFEKELNKSNPDKLKLKNIVKAIIKIIGFVF